MRNQNKIFPPPPEEQLALPVSGKQLQNKISQGSQNWRPSGDIFCCIGTRPEIIKVAPLVYALRVIGLPTKIINSGQHERHVTAPLYAFFGLHVDIDLGLQRGDAGLGELNARLLSEYSRLFAEHRPAIVVVQGDTSSAWQAAQAAFFLQIPVAHIEAGLRTNNLQRPFPEELNRTLIARLAHWNFTPTRSAAAALSREAVPGEIIAEGNTVVDAALWGLERVRHLIPEGISTSMKNLFECRHTVLVTAHRRENWGPGIVEVARAVRDSLFAHKDLACVWVLHPNPAVVRDVKSVFDSIPESVAERLMLVPPQNYGEMLWMMDHAWLLLTDSGGIQEEAVTLGLPVFIAREETERPEVVECGVGRLVGTNAQRIRNEINELLLNHGRHAQMSLKGKNPYGDGHTADRIAARMATDLLHSAQNLDNERDQPYST